ARAEAVDRAVLDPPRDVRLCRDRVEVPREQDGAVAIEEDLAVVVARRPRHELAHEGDSCTLRAALRRAVDAREGRGCEVGHDSRHLAYLWAVIEQLRAAVEALNDGDAGPFASLFAEDAEWRGVSRGHLWWRDTPSRRGPDEAREVLQFQLDQQG